MILATLIATIALAAPVAPPDAKATAQEVIRLAQDNDAKVAKLEDLTERSIQAYIDREKVIVEKDKKIEALAKEVKRAKEALHSRPAWIVMGIGGSMIGLGVASLVFGWAALGRYAAQLIICGVITTGIGYAALLYWAWLVFIGFAAVIVAAILAIRQILIKHNAGVEIADGIQQAKIAGLIQKDNTLARMLDQSQSPAAKAIVRAATE